VTYSGTLSGFSTGAVANTNEVIFSATTLGSDTSNLSVSMNNAPVVTVLTEGSTAATEVARTTFTALTAGQFVTVGGLTFTARIDRTAAQVAAAFASLANNATTGPETANGTYTGTLSGWSTGAVTNTQDIVFTSATASQNVTNLFTPTSGTAPLIVTTQQGGSTSSTETANVTFNAANMVAGDSVTLAGLTFTAGANGATRAQVAAAFSGLAAGTSSANLSSANGTFSGTLTGWSTGASNGTGLTATSSTASQDVTNITASAAQRSALNALSGIVVGGLANQTGENLLTLRGTVNGNLETSQIKLKDNAANTSQILDFSKFGIQFTVDSFQAQSASDIGAALASLNSSSPSYGSDGAFKPGQIVVSNGANSALKFQSGADSEAFIQIDTLNIQTGKTGIAAGSDATMMAVGDAISGTTTGNLGGLGVNDSINSWQTAFRNASAAVDAAIDYISSKRATFGSQMSRLGFITTNLTAQSTNLQNSRSAIIDTDFASETAKLTKGQIMQQAATAMLAQANQMPNVILSLLK
jgi:flagellin